MSDRLAALRRQRTLVQQHLDWLDGEIASAQMGEGPAGAQPATPAATSGSLQAVAPLTPVDQGNPVRNDVVSEQILEEYRVPAESLQQDVRKGCLLYFAAGLAVFALGIVALYFLVQRE